MQYWASPIPCAFIREDNAMQAIWNGTIIAEAKDDEVKVVEGNLYFPLEAVRRDFLMPSHTVKNHVGIGRAGHFHVVVNDQVIEDAVWIFRNPSASAETITDHVAFRGGIDIRP
jgi:uncharacterized protein (DUF427 family)